MLIVFAGIFSSLSVLHGLNFSSFRPKDIFWNVSDSRYDARDVSSMPNEKYPPATQRVRQGFVGRNAVRTIATLCRVDVRKASNIS